MRLIAEAVSIVRIWLNQNAATAVPPVVFWCTVVVMSRSWSLNGGKTKWQLRSAPVAAACLGNPIEQVLTTHDQV